MGAAYDVVVFGGGPAGVPAALQAQRLGARTLLVEKNAMLGGTTTAANICLPGLFHAWGRQVIAGIGWDLVRRTVELAGDELPDVTDDDRPHWRRQVRVCAPLYRAVLLEEVTNAGVDLLLHTLPAEVDFDGDRWTLRLCGKEGLHTVTADRVVDTTGDANIVGLARLPLHRNRQVQPGTLDLRLSGYDVDELDPDVLSRAHTQALAEGRLLPADLGAHGDVLVPFLRKHGENAIHLAGLRADDSAGRTAAEVAGAAALLRIYRFARAVPGLEGLRVDFMATEVGVRETVTIEGITTVTEQDYLDGRLFPDAVCWSFYPIDLHRPDGDGIAQVHLDRGVVPTVPRGALVPAVNRFLAVGGRCLSSDQAANSALRVQATSMATGQAAGAMAALSAAAGVPVDATDLQRLRAALTEAGALVPGA